MRRIFVYEWASGGGGEASLPLLEAGLSMRDALVADLSALPDVEVTCAGHRPEQEGDAFARLTYVVADGTESPPAFVGRLARTHDAAWIVAPETDGILAALHEAVGPRRWIGCEIAEIRRAASKSATLAHLASRGIATPLAFAQGHAGRWIVKPDDGAGSLGNGVHATREAALADVEARSAARERVTLEPFVEGDALSISLLVGRRGGPRLQVLALNRQRLQVEQDGTMQDLGTETGALNPQRDIRAASLRVLAQRVVDAMPGLRGFVGIDVVWHPRQGPLAIEVNPRVTCAYVGLSRLLGRNVAEQVLACEFGAPDSERPLVGTHAHGRT